MSDPIETTNAEKLLPVTYRVEFYPRGFGADGIAGFETSLPLYPFHVGECVDPQGWSSNPLPLDQIFRVQQIRHFIRQVRGSHVSHVLMVHVEVMPRDGNGVA